MAFFSAPLSDLTLLFSRTLLTSELDIGSISIELLKDSPCRGSDPSIILSVIFHFSPSMYATSSDRRQRRRAQGRAPDRQERCSLFRRKIFKAVIP
jgi:hypothetical protein